jgi:hypothetical protein
MRHDKRQDLRQQHAGICGQQAGVRVKRADGGIPAASAPGGPESLWQLSP